MPFENDTMSLRRDFIKLSLGAGVAGAMALSALPAFAQGSAAGPVTLLNVSYDPVSYTHLTLPTILLV